MLNPEETRQAASARPRALWALACLCPALGLGALGMAAYRHIHPSHVLEHILAAAHMPANWMASAVLEEVPDVPLKDERIDPYWLGKQAAVFLYNHTMPHHAEWMHDVAVANMRHHMSLYKLDCVAHPPACGTLGHASCHEYDPPIIFYHHGQWSESFHDDIVRGVTPNPSSSHRRVRAVMRWIGEASRRADQRLKERKRMIKHMDSHGSPSMHYHWQRLMEQKAKEKEAEKQEL